MSPSALSHLKAFLKDRRVASVSPSSRFVVGTFGLLRPGGRFIAYQVMPGLLPLLKKHFKRVRTEFEFRNIPPLFVFTAVK